MLEHLVDVDDERLDVAAHVLAAGGERVRRQGVERVHDVDVAVVHQHAEALDARTDADLEPVAVQLGRQADAAVVRLHGERAAVEQQAVPEGFGLLELADGQVLEAADDRAEDAEHLVAVADHVERAAGAPRLDLLDPPARRLLAVAVLAVGVVDEALGPVADLGVRRGVVRREGGVQGIGDPEPERVALLQVDGWLNVDGIAATVCQSHVSPAPVQHVLPRRRQHGTGRPQSQPCGRWVAPWEL
ncbi:DUF2382 domain-containing protein [Dermatobacter hominis]|nr:DUF2382 domain-containing protein [Dermatobacter hominis]